MSASPLIMAAFGVDAKPASQPLLLLHRSRGLSYPRRRRDGRRPHRRNHGRHPLTEVTTLRWFCDNPKIGLEVSFTLS